MISKLRLQNDHYLRMQHPRPVRLQLDESHFENRRLSLINTYLKSIIKIDDTTREEIIKDLINMANRGELPQDPASFSESVYQIIEQKYPQIARRSGLKEAIIKNITSLYNFYRLTDASAWGSEPPVKTTLTLPDRRAQKFLSAIDEVFFSTYVQNEPFRTELKNFLYETMEKGYIPTDEVLKKFGNLWAEGRDLQVRRIIDTAVTRIRTFAHIRQLAEGGVEELEIVEILDRATCGFCREMDSRIIKVDRAHSVVENAIQLSPEEFQSRYITPAPSQVAAMAMTEEDLTLQGRLPPFHPLCRGRVIARYKKSRSEIETEIGQKLPAVETYQDADYAEYGKKINLLYTEKGVNKKSTQTIICSDPNIFGKKVYLSKERLHHILNDHPSDRLRSSALAIAYSIIGNPDRVFIDTYQTTAGRKKNDYDTKIYFRHIRGINYVVITRRAGPEFIWSAFVCRSPSPRWIEIWVR